MSYEENQHWCKHCWNPVQKISEPKRVIGQGTDIKNWVHVIGSLNPCYRTQLSDDDITDMDPNESI